MKPPNHGCKVRVHTPYRGGDCIVLDAVGYIEMASTGSYHLRGLVEGDLGPPERLVINRGDRIELL